MSQRMAIYRYSGNGGKRGNFTYSLISVCQNSPLFHHLMFFGSFFSTPHASHWMGGGAHVLARSPSPGHHQGGAAGAPRTAAPPRGGATCNSNSKHALYPRKRRGVASGSAGRLSKTSNGRLSGLAQTTSPLAEPFGVGSFGALGCPHTAKKAHFWRP